MSGIFQHTVVDIVGRRVELAHFAGRATLVTNSASLCSFAPRNMELIRALQQHYSTAHPGRVQVFMFPTTDFAHQEKSLPDEIAAWAQQSFQVNATVVNARDGAASLVSPDPCPVYIFGRTHVKSIGANWMAPPIWELCAASCRPPMWNWTKYVCAANGTPMTRLVHTEVSWSVAKQAMDSVLLLK